MKLEELVGQQIMIGVEGSEISEPMVRRFQETQAGGLIVFRPNFKSAQDFRNLISQLEERLKRRLLVAVDHEGGRVIHLAEEITAFPDNLALGQTENAYFAEKQGEVEGEELRRLGIDVNLAPTLDVLTETYSPNIGIRSYGKNSELVSKMGCARIKSMQAKGLSACGKHFPGLGPANLDPHLNLPMISLPEQEMEKVHFKPFMEAIEAGVDCIMTSHPIYPELEEAKIPATFSKKIVTKILREKLRFEGVVFSDDLEMGALKNLCSIGESAVRAIEAGHDVVLACHDPSAQKEVYEALLNAYQKGRLKQERLQQSIDRISKLKNRRKARFDFNFKSFIPSALPEQISEKAVSWVEKPKIKIQTEKAALVFPDISELEEKFFIEPDFRKPQEIMKEIFEEFGRKYKSFQIYSLNPSDEEIQRVSSCLQGTEISLFFCFDAMMYPGCQKLWKALRQVCPQRMVFFLRNPYDSQWLEQNESGMQVWGFRKQAIVSAVKHLLQSLNEKD